MHKHEHTYPSSHYPPPIVHGYPPVVRGYPPKIAVDPTSTVHMPWLPQTNSPPPPLPPTEPSGSDLFRAVESGDITAVHYFISKGGITANYTDPVGNSTLHVAARKGYSQVCSYLMEQGVNPNVTNERGHTPIMWAVTNGHLNCVATLVKKGADSAIQDAKGYNSLMHAALDVNGTEAEGHTPLCWAATNVHIGKLDSAGRTAMHWAAHNNHLKCIELLAKAQCRACAQEENPECHAKKGENLLTIQDIEGQTPADCAKSKGNADLATRINLKLWGEKTWAHSNIMWSKPEKTLVPAGLMVSGVILLTKVHFDCLSFPAFVLIESLMANGVSDFYKLMTQDPGIILPDENDFMAALNAAEFGVEPQDFCRFCKVRKPPRAKHCRVCNVCTTRFDHHCFWIYNCVAEKNIWRFYVFLLQVLFHITFFILVTLNCIYHTSILDTVGEAFYLHAQKAWAIVFCAIVFVPENTLKEKRYELMRPQKGLRPKKFSGKRLLAFLMNGSGIFDSGEGDETV